MPWNTGVFSRSHNWISDRDGGIKIRADRMDEEFDNFKDGLNEIAAGTLQYVGGIRGYDGTALLPGYAFNGDLNTGMLRIGADNIGWSVNGVLELDLSAARLAPGANDGLALGVPGTAFSDLALASGGVIDFGGDVTITHSADGLAFGGAANGYSFDDDLLLPTGGTINFGDDVVITHLPEQLRFGGANGGFWFSTAIMPLGSCALGLDGDGFYKLALTDAGNDNTVSFTIANNLTGNRNGLLYAPDALFVRDWRGWLSSSPVFTGFGTAASVSIWTKRDGDTLKIRGYFTSGTSTAVEARMTMIHDGVAVTSDATKVAAIQIAGPGIPSAVTATSYYVLIESSKNYVTFGLQNASVAGLTKANGNGFLTAGTKFSFTAEVPISGWA